MQAQDRTATLDCRGGDGRVEGNRNVLSFRGTCRALRLFGEDNRITVEVTPGAEIQIQGQRNRVSYLVVGGTEPPRVSVAGIDDIVSPGGPQLLSVCPSCC